MPWVEFTKNFNFRPPENRQCHVAYTAGTTHFVRQVCAVEAIRLGKAVQAKRPGDAPERGALDVIEKQLARHAAITGKK